MTTKTFIAGAAIAPYRILKPGTVAGELVPATAATDKLLAVADGVGAAAGESIDAHFGGIVQIQFGGTVAAGAKLTSNATGKAVTATEGDNVIGYALNAATADEVGYAVIDRS